MSDKMNESIKDIAIKHGVVLSKDDPVLILQTMNEKLVEANRKAQQEMLAQFKEEMENISSQWKEDAKEKAEKVLNVALAGSKETMSKLLQESTTELFQAMNKMVSASLAEAHNLEQQTRKFSWFALLSSVSILIVSCYIMMLYIFKL